MKKFIENEKILNDMSIDKGNNAVSHTETTGLIPSRTDDEYEINSYKEINEYQQKPILRKPQRNNR